MTYEVDQRLDELGLSRPFLVRCAAQGDVDRRNVPVFGFDGHPEYAANSRILSALCEYGGETDGGWRRGNFHRIPVAMNANDTVAIHATAGTAGTGKVEGDPHNRSLKGPWSQRAANPQPTLGPDVDEMPPDFYWFFTNRDNDGLWAELYQPILGDQGVCIDFTERIILGNIGGPTDPIRQTNPADPIRPSDISVTRRAG